MKILLISYLNYEYFIIMSTQGLQKNKFFILENKYNKIACTYINNL